jgi:hypothetical protein
VSSVALIGRPVLPASGEERLADVLAGLGARGTANTAELVNCRYSIIASFAAIRVWSGMKCVRGSRT